MHTYCFLLSQGPILSLERAEGLPAYSLICCGHPQGTDPSPDMLPSSSRPNFSSYSTSEMLLNSGSPEVPSHFLSQVLSPSCVCWSGNYRAGTKLDQLQIYSRSEAGRELRGSARMPEGMASGPWETLLPSLEQTAPEGSSPFSSVTAH